MLENQFKYGYVIGMLVSSIGDSLDAGRFPDVVPADVTVTFSRVRGQYKQQLDEPVNGVKSMVVNHKPVTAMLTKEGYLTSDFDPVRKLVYEGATPGIWLVAGLYKVSLGGLLPDFEIQVTEDYTPENPLDIADWLSYSAPPGSAVKLVNVPVGSDGQLMQWDSGGIVWKDREVLQGPPNVLSIGTVTSADTPSATITGTSPNQELSLVLPKGDKGDKGDRGVPGALANASSYILVGPGRPDQPVTTGGIITSPDTTPVGSEYRSTDGAGVGAFVWMKRPGNKWEVVDGDTGWRSVPEWCTDITGAVLTSGTLYVRRVLNTVHYAITRTTYPSPLYVRPPSGFKPSRAGAWPWVNWDNTAAQALYWNGSYWFPSSGPQWNSNVSTQRSTDWSHSVTEAWPITLPGTPA